MVQWGNSSELWRENRGWDDRGELCIGKGRVGTFKMMGWTGPL